MATTTLRLSDQLEARIAALAEMEDKSAHAFILDALEQHADRSERRRAYLAAGDEAAQEFDRTGIAYALEDVERYIAARAAGRKVTCPKPRKYPTKS